MVPPPDETPKSLGDGVTGSDVGPPEDSSAQSLGDAQTFGGTDPDGETPFDDGMAVVDLADRYTIEGVLGKGGMGEVLLATDTRLKRKVAIKRVLGDLARNQTAVRRFLTEAQSIAALSNHPNIVDIYDFGRDQDGPFLIMEYIDGGCLLDRCQDGPLPLKEAVDLTCQLCGALEMAHEAGIIHRDIKPANVLLTKNGIPALTDFGLAKNEVDDTGHTMAGAVLGTLDFMPPEQRRDAAEVDARSDLWSLAATLYQMVTGESPRVIDLDAVPKQLRQTFAKALKTKKDDRYQTVREFRDALRDSQQPLEQIAGLLSKRVVDTDGQEGGQDIFHGTEVGETVPALAVKPPIRTPGQPRLAAEAERLLKVGKTAIRKAHDYVAGHNPSQASRQSTPFKTQPPGSRILNRAERQRQREHSQGWQSAKIMQLKPLLIVVGILAAGVMIACLGVVTR